MGIQEWGFRWFPPTHLLEALPRRDLSQITSLYQVSHPHSYRELLCQFFSVYFTR